MPEIQTGQVAYATKLSAHRSPGSTKIPFRPVLSRFLRWFTQVLSLSPELAPESLVSSICGGLGLGCRRHDHHHHHHHHHDLGCLPMRCSKSLGEAKIHGIRIHGLQAKKKAETAKDGFFSSEKKDAKAEPKKTKRFCCLDHKSGYPSIEAFGEIKCQRKNQQRKQMTRSSRNPKRFFVLVVATMSYHPFLSRVLSRR